MTIWHIWLAMLGLGLLGIAIAMAVGLRAKRWTKIYKCRHPIKSHLCDNRPGPDCPWCKWTYLGEG